MKAPKEIASKAERYKELKKEIDKLSKSLRETDMKIQELNWTTELLED